MDIWLIATLVYTAWLVLLPLLMIFIATRKRWLWQVRAMLLLPFMCFHMFWGVMIYLYQYSLRNFVILMLMALLPLAALIVTLERWQWQVRIVLILLLAGGLIGLPVYQTYQVKKKKEAALAEHSAYREEAWVYFHKKCSEDSGYFIYKTVTEPQESVYMMKPRRAATSKEMKDQFWMGDPYAGAHTYDMPELSGFLGDKVIKAADDNELPLFSFVETHDLDDPDRLWRYYPTDDQNPSDTCPRSRKWYRCEPTESIQSRYGFTWDDLSTREDRHYWVARSRLQIIDLQTQEVIAERIGYVFEHGLGHTWGTIPWRDIYRPNHDNSKNWKNNFCPPRKPTSDTSWIWSVLNNLPFKQPDF
ncbi:MAG: hypothetical protein FWG81_08075 [Betaproteobacteria bacterium]|nr:hypothetical protein [Betaproteobacteria bacterium]